MKRLIFLLPVLISLSALSQTHSGYVKRNTKDQVIASASDSTTHIPAGATNTLSGGWSGAGAIRFNTTDSALYMWTGTQWIRSSQEIKNGIVSGLQVSWLSGLTFDVTPGVYYIQGTRYTFAGGQITLTDAVTDPKITAIVVNTSQALDEVEGEEAADPSKPTTDGFTQMELTFVTLTGAGVPLGVANTLVWDENVGSPTEWVGSAVGATANFNSTTNTCNGTKSTFVTTIPSVGNDVRYTKGSGNVNIGDFNHIRMQIRLNAAIPGSRNISVSLMNGGQIISASLFLTDFGLNKNTTGSCQTLIIPFSAFSAAGGLLSTNITAIRFTREGGAITNVQFDNINLQSGLATNPPQNIITSLFRRTDSVFARFSGGQTIFQFKDSTGGGATLVPLTGTATATGNVIANTAGYSVSFKAKDSMGTVLSYAAGSSLTGKFGDNTATASVTLGTGVTTINGAAYNLNNYFTSSRFIAVDNYTITGSIVLPTRNNTNRGFAINIPSGESGIFYEFHAADSAGGYLTFSTGATLADYTTTNKNTSQFIYTTGDTINFILAKKQRTASMFIQNRRNGSSTAMSNLAYPQQGSLNFHFLNAGDTKIVDSFTVKYNEIQAPNVLAYTNSILWGSVTQTMSGGAFRGVLSYGNWTGILAGAPAENMLDAIDRAYTDGLTANPDLVLIDHVVNDRSLGVDSFAARLRRLCTIHRTANPNVKFVFTTGVPQTAGTLAVFRDSIIAIAAVYGATVADTYTATVASAGFAMDSKWNSGDGIHPNNAWHYNIGTPMIGWAIAKQIPVRKSLLSVQLPVTNNKGLYNVKMTTDNQLVSVFDDGDGGNYILNRYLYDINSPQDSATINTRGQYSTDATFIIPGTGTKASPNFSVNINPSNPFLAGATTMTNIYSGNFNTNISATGTNISGGDLWFTNDGATAARIRTATQALQILFRGTRTATEGLVLQSEGNDGSIGKFYPLVVKNVAGTITARIDSVGQYYGTAADGTGYDSVAVWHDGKIAGVAGTISGGGGGGSGDVVGPSSSVANEIALFDGTTGKLIKRATTTGLLKATSGVIASATAETDYTTPTGTGTLTNKRWTARVGSTTSSATPTINTDNVDIYKLTAQAADITSFTTNLSGTPVDGDMLEIQITGTAARAITWGASFVSSTVTLPATTVTTATLSVVFQYFTTSSYGNNKWVCVNSF